MHSFIMASQ